MKIFDLGRSAVLAFDEFLPFGGVEPVRIGARLPDIDAAGTVAVFAHPVIFTQEAGNALILRRRRLKSLGDVLKAGRLGELERDNRDNHRRLLFENGGQNTRQMQFAPVRSGMFFALAYVLVATTL